MKNINPIVTTVRASHHTVVAVHRQRPSERAPSQGARRARQRGLSLIEMMVALAITAMLLTATMAALDASFKAYADASEQASTQIASRMVSERLMQLIRTSTAHGPLLPDASADPPVTYDATTNVITSNFIELLDQNGDLLRIEYRVDDQELWLIRDPLTATPIEQPIIGGVTNAQFFVKRRTNAERLLVLERGTVDITVQPDEDTTLSIENGASQAVRIIASTTPRRLDN